MTSPHPSSAAAGYPPPLDQLLTLGKPGDPDELELRGWLYTPFADYVAMGIGPQHADDLLRMALDAELTDRDSPECYAPVHACRALGALRVQSAIKPLIGLLRRIMRNDEDMWADDIMNVLVSMGPPAFRPVASIALDQRESWGLRMIMIETIERLGVADESLRSKAIALLSEILRWAKRSHEDVASGTVCALVELSAIETLPLIRKLYQRGVVDEEFAGPLHRVELEIAMSREARNEHRRKEADQIAARVRGFDSPE
jgi:hypothetical protein